MFVLHQSATVLTKFCRFDTNLTRISQLTGEALCSTTCPESAASLGRAHGSGSIAIWRRFPPDSIGLLEPVLFAVIVGPGASLIRLGSDRLICGAGERGTVLDWGRVNPGCGTTGVASRSDWWTFWPLIRCGFLVFCTS